MAKIILISGGVRSGKSSFAEEFALKMDSPVAYLATAQALDEEMTARIEIHKERRSPEKFSTFEEPYFIQDLLLKHQHKFRTWLLDCLTLYVSNLLFAQVDPTKITNQFISTKIEQEILSQIKTLLETLAGLKINFVAVTNEVGWGLVPADSISRAYRDILGRANQQFAAAADEVYLLSMGLPLRLK
ncbi:MAG: bifunctional adenosylcobinamide kinase/adenosylcobinamide-phosphate guanylyltransferase [Peptococcia bacterium]